MPRQRTEVNLPSGINKDISPFELPVEVWSDGSNINFRRTRTNSTLPYSNPFEIDDIDARPTFAIQFFKNEFPFWLYVGKGGDGNAKIRTTDGTTSDLIGSGYGAYNRSASWVGTEFNGAIILNSRDEFPQQVLGTSYSVATDLDNWDLADNKDSIWSAYVSEADPTPIDGARCEVIRPYKNFLCALDCYDKADVRYPNMIRWSNGAQSGEVPTSWDPEATGDRAGLYSLADTPGTMIDGLTLGDYFVIYKTDAVWLMQFIGGEFTFSFRKLFGDDTGILSKDCVEEFDGKHFVLSPSGAYVHNGSSKEEVMDYWVKDEFFTNVDPQYIRETKVVADHNNNEVWVYYISTQAEGTTADGPYADKALVWNWREKKWTRKDLQAISYIAEGYVDPSSAGVDTWDSDVDVPPSPDPNQGEDYDSAWNKDKTTWDGQLNFNTTLEGLLLANYDTQSFALAEYASGKEPYSPTSYVRRIGIDFGNDRRFKYLTRIVPHILGQNPVTITVFTSDVQTPDPTPAAVMTFDPLVDVDVDCHVTGRYIGVQFEAEDLWTINGYTLEWEPTGKF